MEAGNDCRELRHQHVSRRPHRGPGPAAGAALGDNGERLHQWAFSSDAVGREVLARGDESTGAVICGRRSYDDSIRWWGAYGPAGPARLPVLSSRTTRPPSPRGRVYHFVSGGIEEALAEAKAAASEKNVSVIGGADIGQQFIRSGLVDELPFTWCL